MTSDETLKYLEELGAENACLLEPRSDYDSCLVGVGCRFKDGPLAVYDLAKVMAVLEADMTQEEDQVRLCSWSWTPRGWDNDYRCQTGVPALWLHLVSP